MRASVSKVGARRLCRESVRVTGPTCWVRHGWHLARSINERSHPHRLLIAELQKKGLRRCRVTPLAIAIPMRKASVSLIHRSLASHETFESQTREPCRYRGKRASAAGQSCGAGICTRFTRRRDLHAGGPRPAETAHATRSISSHAARVSSAMANRATLCKPVPFCLWPRDRSIASKIFHRTSPSGLPFTGRRAVNRNEPNGTCPVRAGRFLESRDSSSVGHRWGYLSVRGTRC